MSIEDVKVTSIDVQSNSEFKNHEYVFRIAAPAHDFLAFVAVHNTVLGAGEGGIRYKYYADEDAAITDVLRLSEGMTLKNSAADLKAGGGKCVVMAGKGKPKPDSMTLQLLAEGFNQINADKILYYGAQDMNISEDDLDEMMRTTSHIKGARSHDPTIVGGDPSPSTAFGVFECMKAAIEHVYGEGATLKGRRIAMQGIGNVGGVLAQCLLDAGAVVIACDPDDEAFKALPAIERVGLHEIYDVPADVFAPNAIGGTLDYDTVERLDGAGVMIICGAANNQQHDQIGHLQSRELMSRGMLYCPDFIVNAGGIIWVNQVGEDAAAVRERVISHMPKSLQRIIALHQDTGKDMGTLAEEYALGRLD